MARNASIPGIPLRQSLRFRLIAFTMLAFILLGSFMVLVLNAVYQERVDVEYTVRGVSVARMASYLLSGEMLDRYLETSEPDENYEAILKHLDMLRVENDVKYLYVQRIVEGGAVFVWDTDPEEPVGLGEFDAWDDSYNAVLEPLRRGESVNSAVLDTKKWGYLLVTFEPVLRADGSVAGYVGVNISMDVIMREKNSALFLLGLAVALIGALVFVIDLYIAQKNVINPVNAIRHSLDSFLTGEGATRPKAGGRRAAKYTGELAALEGYVTETKQRVAGLIADIRDTENYARLMLDAAPLGCVLWNQDYEVIECNEAIMRLLGFTDKAACLAGFMSASPEYQEDGRYSRKEAKLVLQKAMREGSCGFHWTHQAADGTPVPVEVTAVRVGHGERFIIAAYMRDMREHNQMMREIAYRSRLLHTVNQISATLIQSEADTFEDDLLHSMGVMAKAVGADRAYIWENYINDGELYCYQTYEWSEGAEPQQGKEIISGVSYREVLPSWEAAFTRRRCINGIVRELSPSEFDLLTQQGILSLIVVPIYRKDQFWGFVGFDDCHRERVFTENEESILRSASELIAGALIRKDMQRDIRHLETKADRIYYDPLTGIYNRLYLDETTKRVFAQLSRSQSMFSVMMVDIDYFKKYNDTYGHGAGDTCLVAVAGALKSCITRTEDFVARYGGEEFTVILPYTDEDGAKLLAGKMLKKVRECGIPHEKSDAAACVTVSIGVATGIAEYPIEAEDYIRLADEMLYRSKNEGRNRYTASRIGGQLERPYPYSHIYAVKEEAAI